ncbi:hypothetical protein HF264_19535 [Rhizobium leguminosarum]|nr:hypothetical protein [Rhizobium leguminosarum]
MKTCFDPHRIAEKRHLRRVDGGDKQRIFRLGVGEIENARHGTIGTRLRETARTVVCLIARIKLADQTIDIDRLSADGSLQESHPLARLDVPMVEQGIRGRFARADAEQR